MCCKDRSNNFKLNVLGEQESSVDSSGPGEGSERCVW